MPKIAIITDTHFGIKNDAQYILDYQQKFYDNIFFPYLVENNIKTVFHLGDLFDRRKYINFITLNKTKEMFLDRLKKMGVQMYIIPGNHDVYHKNTNKINSLSQLLSGYENVCVFEDPYVLKEGGVDFAFIPWINNENYSQILEFLKTTSAEYLCGHLELKGFKMYSGIINQHGMEQEPFNKFKEVWTGHFHHKNFKDNIKYLGSPMEFTFADCEDPKGFYDFDTDTKELTFHLNSYTLYEKIYYNDSTPDMVKYIKNMDLTQFEGKNIKLFVVKKTAPGLFENFVDNLYKQNLIDMTIMEDYSEFHESNVDLEIQEQSTKDLMDAYVQLIETDMDKEKIKTILSNLHIEALHATV